MLEICPFGPFDYAQDKLSRNDPALIRLELALNKCGASNQH
jgi:hypothetical protein